MAPNRIGHKMYKFNLHLCFFFTKSHQLVFSSSHFLSMPQCSQHKKATSLETIVDSSSENNDFAAVASDDRYVDPCFLMS